MFSLVQTVRYYQSRFIFLFAWRRFGVDFVSLILQHARHFLSLKEREMRSLLFERDDDLMGKEIWRKAFKERASKDEIVLSETTTRSSLSLVPLPRALKPFKEERKRERSMRVSSWEARFWSHRRGSKLPPKDQHHLARALVALSFSLSLFIISFISPPSSRRSHRILK